MAGDEDFHRRLARLGGTSTALDLDLGAAPRNRGVKAVVERRAGAPAEELGGSLDIGTAHGVVELTIGELAESG